MLKRGLIDEISRQLYRNKVIIIYGARRTGKTTLSRMILDEQEKLGKRTLYINCEFLDAQKGLATTNEKLLKSYLGDNDIVVLDEAQSIPNIGRILKIVVDTYPEIQIIATGSSSFDLSNKLGEPLVGRSRQFILYPFSLSEIRNNANFHDTISQIDKLLIFGSYPAVYSMGEEDAKFELMNIASNYLFKDILEFEQVKNSKTLQKLLELLALQLGNEVSYSEIGQKLEISNHTVMRYIDLLEKCFVIFSLRSFSRNLRNEINKSQKIYFYDLGIRNALIQNFNKLDLRLDVGGLWENFCIVEKLKYNQANNIFFNKYFWRMYSGQEIDYIEEYDGNLHAYEFKYNPKAKVKKPSKFLETYENTSFNIIHRDNWFEFLLGEG